MDCSVGGHTDEIPSQLFHHLEVDNLIRPGSLDILLLTQLQKYDIRICHNLYSPVG